MVTDDSLHKSHHDSLRDGDSREALHRQSRPGLFIPNPKLHLREQIREVMRFRHYSVRTEEAYWNWIRQFILFHRKQHPRDMGEAHVHQFLSYLAMQRNVAGATQSQALNALVFFYAQVLHRPLGQLDDFARPNRPARVPVVLTEMKGRGRNSPSLSPARLFERGDSCFHTQAAPRAIWP